MGVRDTTILKPLFGKHLKKKRIVSFDIETHGKNNDFYMGGVYSEEEGYKSFYSKQAMIDEFKRKFYFDNTVIVATNLAFDLTGIYYNTPQWNELDIVMNGGRLIFANMYAKKSKRRTTFIDTFNFAPFSVAFMGKILGHDKMESPKAIGKKPQTLKEFIELEDYNKRDCEVTYYFMKLLVEGFYKAGGKTKTTIASTSMDIFRRKYLRRPIKKEITKLGYSTDKIVFASYYGGRTEVFSRGKIKNMKLYDINSLYPSVMVKEYPLPSSAVHLEQKDCRGKYIQEYEGVSTVKVLCPHMRYPILPLRYEGKLIFPTGEFEGTYTHVELREAVKQGYIIQEIKETLYYKKTFYPFKEFVQDLYNKRLELKKKGDPNELVYKLLLNSLYGKFAQKNMSETIFFNMKFLTDTNIEHLRVDPDVVMKDDENGMIIRKKECDEAFVIPILSSYTTAYARLRLHYYLKKYEGVYCDTDSIVTEKEIPESNRLGEMKLEYNILEGILVRPKMYYLHILDKGEEKDIIKLKGVPKKLLYNGEETMLNKEIFTSILEGESVFYEKFTKLKEGVRRCLLPNSIMTMEKFIQLTDNKRFWESPFSHKHLIESKALNLYLNSENSLVISQ